jgi:hypothetical protein
MASDEWTASARARAEAVLTRAAKLADEALRIASLALLSIRFIQGFIYWGGGSRRFIYAPAYANLLSRATGSPIETELIRRRHGISFLVVCPFRLHGQRQCGNGNQLHEPFPVCRADVSRALKCVYKDLDWQRVIDYIAAEIWIVTLWLDTLVCSRRARQQRIAARLCRRGPIVFPAAPCVPAYRVKEVALEPRCATVEADPDLGDIGIPRPSGTENGIGATGFEPLVHTGACDL